VTQRPTALGIRLSPKNPDKNFYPKWKIPGQSRDRVAIATDVPHGTVGLYISDGEALYGSTSPVPCVLLLIGEQRFYIPKQCVRLVSNEEIEETLRDG
jgi:hypothetical protein